MTGDDLYREICRNPEDDTLRLAYADWLEEQPAPVVRCPHCRHGEHVRRCRRCHGAVRDEWEHHSGEAYDGTWLCNRTAECQRCGGTGSTADTEGADRAELIRLQVRQAVMTREYDAQSPLPEGHPAHAEWLRLSGLRHGITVRYPQWYLLPCGECGGKGRVPGASVYGYSREMEACDVCGGTGDLLRARGVSGASLTPPSRNRRVTFDRGFPGIVFCRLADVYDRYGGVTPWAAAVVRRVPVTEFYLVDRRPIEVPAGFGWVWQDDPVLPEHVPGAVWRELPFHFMYDVIRGARVTHGGDYSNGANIQLNVHNLSKATGRAVRAAVYGR